MRDEGSGTGAVVREAFIPDAFGSMGLSTRRGCFAILTACSQIWRDVSADDCAPSMRKHARDVAELGRIRVIGRCKPYEPEVSRLPLRPGTE